MDIKKYFSLTLMKEFLNQRTLETLNRGIEELGVKISKRCIENKRLAIIAFVLYNIELPPLLRVCKWFLRGYLTTLANKLIDNLIELVKKTRVAKKRK